MDNPVNEWLKDFRKQFNYASFTTTLEESELEKISEMESDTQLLRVIAIYLVKIYFDK